MKMRFLENFKEFWFKWRSLRNIPFRKKFFIGSDLKGNTYWEFSIDGSSRSLRRIVQYATPGEHYNQTASSQDLQPQCIMWLRKIRPDFPTIQELVGDLQRQHGMKILAAQANERWKKDSLLQNPGLTADQRSRLKEITNKLNHNDVKHDIKDSGTEQLSPIVKDVFEKPKDNPIEQASMKPKSR